MRKTIEDYAEIIGVLTELNPEESKTFMNNIVYGLGLTEEKDVRHIMKKIIVAGESGLHNVTTQTLVESIARISMGVYNKDISIDEMIEYTLAVGVATRESGIIIGDTIKSVMSRIDYMNNSKDVSRSGSISATTALEGLSSVWNILSEDTKKDVSISIAGMYQMSRFWILMEQLSKK